MISTTATTTGRPTPTSIRAYSPIRPCTRPQRSDGACTPPTRPALRSSGSARAPGPASRPVIEVPSVAGRSTGARPPCYIIAVTLQRLDTAMRAVRTLGLLGTGVIGGGWAARALHYGIDVIAADVNPA